MKHPQDKAQRLYINEKKKKQRKQKAVEDENDQNDSQSRFSNQSDY